MSCNELFTGVGKAEGTKMSLDYVHLGEKWSKEYSHAIELDGWGQVCEPALSV